jgi:hypothetical protein
MLGIQTAMSERLNGYLMDEWANQSAPRNKDREPPKPATEASPEAPAQAQPAAEPPAASGSTTSATAGCRFQRLPVGKN